MELDFIKKQMEEALSHLEGEFSKIRTGRANPAMLDVVKVEAYGNLTPLNQVAMISVPEATQLVVKPYDPSIMKELEEGIAKANLDVNPVNDGEVIRINVPALTEETRKTFVKEAKAKAEEGKVAIRNIRKDANNKIKKNDELTEDDKKSQENKVQEFTDQFNKKIEEKLSEKEKEIMTI